MWAPHCASFLAVESLQQQWRPQKRRQRPVLLSLLVAADVRPRRPGSGAVSSSAAAAAAHAHEAAQRFPHANKFPRANVCSRQQLRRVYVNGKSRTVCSTKIVPLPKQGVG